MKNHSMIDYKNYVIVLSYIVNNADISHFATKIESAGFTTTIMSPEHTEFVRYNPWSGL